MKLSPETLALAYEIRCEYHWQWKQIADFVGCNPDHLRAAIAERVNAK